MANPRARVKVPDKANKGEIISIRTLIPHRMESGRRIDAATGNVIPRRIIHKFVANFNGVEVFAVDLDTGISTNPFFKFAMRADESGEFEFLWFDDNGEIYSKKSELKVE